MIKNLMLSIIRGYKRYISPSLGRHCRFIPTCSEYAYEAIIKFGVVKGVVLAMWRLLRCNPFNKNFGYDPVPEK